MRRIPALQNERRVMIKALGKVGKRAIAIEVRRSSVTIESRTVMCWKRNMARTRVKS
jgi:hypothetical protein